MGEWAAILRDIGVPAAMLLVLARGLWVGGKWVGDHVVRPLVERHLRFVDDVSKTLLAVRKSSFRMARAQSQFVKAHVSLIESLRQDLESRFPVSNQQRT